MKKLMTMIAAVATAFGLYADPVNYGTSFEGLTAGTSIFNAETEGAKWAASADPNATALVADYGEEGKVTGNARPAFFSGSTQNQYLNVKTALGNPIARNLDTAWDLATGNFYSDTLVKFTNFDSAPESIDGKIAVWVQEIENDNGTITTNLMVTAGSTLTGTRKDYLVQSNWEPSAAQGGWTRVTIKAIPSVVKNDTMPGFAIWVDQNPIGSTVSKADIDALSLSLTDIAKNYNKEGNLFLSMTQSGGAVSTINAVAFDGQGQIDDVLLTDVAPSFAGDPQFFFITAGDANVESITVDGEAYNFGDPLLLGQLPYVFTVVPTYNSGFIDGVWTATEGATVNMANHQFTVTAGGATGTIVSKAALVKIGSKFYGSLAEALADTTALKGADGLVELSGALTIASTVTIPTVDGVDAVVLDLAGNTITYTGTTGYAFTVPATAALKVTDSSEDADGKIAANSIVEDGGIIDLAATTSALSIDKGWFDGAINSKKGTNGNITGGAFNAELAERLIADGYIAKLDTSDNYWKVAQANYVAQIGATKYETIKEAVAAANEAESPVTIELLKDCEIAKTDTETAGDPKFALVFSKSATITGAHTITGPQDQYGIFVGNDATLTLAGGATITPNSKSSTENTPTSHSILNIGFAETGWENSAGNFILDGGAIIGNGVNGNAIAAQTGTVTITTGVITNIGSRGVKVEIAATAVINGGIIGDVGITKPALHCAGNGTITVNGGEINGTCNNGVTIPGTSTATFDRDQTTYCAEDYKTKNVSGDRFSVVAIQYATYKVIPGEGVESWSASQAGEKFDIDDAVTLTITPVLESGYELDTEESTLTATLEEAKEYEFVIVTKSAGPVAPEWAKEAGLAEKYAEWAAGKTIVDPTSDATKDAFLLNCDFDEVVAKKAAFKIASIENDGEKWVVKVVNDKGEEKLLGEGDTYANGYVHIVDVTETLDSETKAATAAKGFYQATLTLKPAN